MGTKAKILIIDDDAVYTRIVAELLTGAGYTARTAPSGRAGLSLLRRYSPDLILLDYRLPDLTGLDVLRRIRAESNIPIIFVSGTSSEADKVTTLEQGADDHLEKPFHQDELIARITALLRRVGWSPHQEPVLTVGMLRVDIARRQASVNNQNIHLTPNEFAILVTLVRHAGDVVHHDALLRAVWGGLQPDNLRALRVNISRLRRKLAACNQAAVQVQTVPGMGYRITAAYAEV